MSSKPSSSSVKLRGRDTSSTLSAASRWSVVGSRQGLTCAPSSGSDWARALSKSCSCRERQGWLQSWAPTTWPGDLTRKHALKGLH